MATTLPTQLGTTQSSTTHKHRLKVKSINNLLLLLFAPLASCLSSNLQQTQQAPPRPNLYLYSPSNNTLIPCEEIIIPNPVMSPEGPVYSGPTNIYLAYPVQVEISRW